PSPSQFKNGVAIKIFNAERPNPNAKIMDTLLRRATERIKTDEDVNEVLLVDQYGYITEGSRSNVFFVEGDSIVTPPLHQILEGVTRKQVLELCKSAQIPVVERLVHISALSQIVGLFLTGTSRRVLPVNRIDNIKIHVNHPIVRQLQCLLENRVREYISEFNARQNL
ncbi:MAG TPA: aminotransferase class IV, partial [Bacteroidales bacterium]|nr:aminotransferase class IV [Bacteroidales bacterium]